MTRRWRRPGAVATGLLAVTALTVPATATARVAPTPAGLAAVSAAVGAADVAGTAWYTAAGRVVVTADTTVTAAEIARIRAAAGAHAGVLRIERVPGVLTELISGGDRIYTVGKTCTAGFNVRNATQRYILTAGHCTFGTITWYADSGLTVPIGPVVATSYPGSDYGLIHYANPAVPSPGTVGAVDITGPGNPAVGMPVARRGAVSGISNGTVTALNVTVNYGQGAIVHGLVRTDICSQPGDSGAPLYSGPLALGLASGGSGNCVTGGVTYFQRIGPALAALGVSIY
ncbi:S1 family peptidase [Streptomyces yaizuensis]|uniref:S1 family peptidase n=1 Tax=Streptomyces yaizuensis TaxID=2989713 RepID=UPI002B1FA89F|nr:S1 family peptidase [Streptomyces sp. YSPA8]